MVRKINILSLLFACLAFATHMMAMEQKQKSDKPRPMNQTTLQVSQEHFFNHYAAYHGLEIVDPVESYIDLRDKAGYTVLHWAAASTDPKSLLHAGFFIENGVDLEALGNEFQQTALHRACVFGSLDMVKLLLEKGANKNATDFLGFTPDQWAMRASRTEVVKLFKDVTTPEFQKERILHKIIGAIVSYENYDKAKKLLKKNPNLIDEKLPKGNTLLHIAAEYDNAEAASILLEEGADPFSRNDEGKTPKDLAPPDSGTWHTLDVYENIDQYHVITIEIGDSASDN